MPMSKGVRQKGGKQLSVRDGEDQSASYVTCCSPKECFKANYKIDPSSPGDAVRVICNNEVCSVGNWMHAACFEAWEDVVLSYLRSCGRARSWSEKQRMQNLWTKKGYDLAFKACDCLCKKGHLRKDLDYSPPLLASIVEQDERRTNRKGKKKMEKVVVGLTITGSRGGQPFHQGSSSQRQHSLQILRPRTQSLSSTGSSPPPSSSPGSSHSEESVVARPDATSLTHTPTARKFEFFADKHQAAAGNIFKQREDLRAFNHLPLEQKNSYHIKVEDEGPYGNDETRCFVLSTLSSHKATSVPCVICGGDLIIYDRYPLIDGTFFVSPEQYNGEITVGTPGAGPALPSSLANQHRSQYLNAVCMRCLEGETEIRCLSCDRPWNGRNIQLGTMYSYDVFAATPCCPARLRCKSCGGMAADPSQPTMQYFSSYSRPLRCAQCKTAACHFVKPLKDVYYPTQRGGSRAAVAAVGTQPPPGTPASQRLF